MITSDEFGNVTGDTSQPDQMPKGGLVGTPSLDEMKHALSMWGSKTADVTKQMLQAPFAAKQRMSNALPATLSQAAQLAQVPGEVTLATASSYPAAIAKEMGFPEASKAIQYQPRSPYTYPVLEELGKLPEQITGSSMGFGPIPELMQPEFQRGFTPNDARVLGAKATQFGREVKNIPTDFVNAQSGVKTLNPLGDTTLGTNLQGVAESVGDTLQRRQAAGQSTIPGVPEFVQPTTSMYAVRPKGSKIQRPTLYETSTEAELIDPMYRVLTVSVPSPSFLKPETIPADKLVNDYRERFLSDLPQAVKDQLVEHSNKKDAEEFPGANRHEIASALEIKYDKSNARSERKLEHLNDFFKNTPEGQQAAREHKVPTVDEYKDRLNTAANILNNNFTNFLSKNIGSFGSKTVDLASKGTTYREPEEILKQASMIMPSAVRAIEEQRRKAGFPPEGTFAPQIAAKKEELKTHNENALSAQQAKAKFLSDMVEQGIGHDEYSQTPEFAKIKADETKATAKRDKANAELDKLKLGHAQELIEDSMVFPTTKQSIIENRGYGRAQLYPDVRNPNVTSDQPLYTAYDLNTDRLGLQNIGEKLWGDIVEGRMTANQATATSIDNYIEKMHKQRGADKIAQEAKRQKELATLTEKLKPVLESVPPHLRYNKSSVVEINDRLPYDEIVRRMSEDTDILEHCMGEAGTGSDRNINPITKEKRVYEPTYETLTGEINPRGKGSPSRSYASNTFQGGQFQASFRDNKTAYPVASLQFEKRGDGKYSIGFVSGHKNGAPDSQYADDIKNYLNQKSDIIADDTTDRLYGNLRIYDTQDKSKRELLRRNLGLTHQEMLAHNLDSLPRFVTRQDAHDHIVQSAGQTQRVVENLESERALVQDQLDQHLANRRNWDEADEAHHDDLVDTLRDLNQRIEQQRRQPVDNVPHSDISYDSTLERLSDAGNNAAQLAYNDSEFENAEEIRDEVNDIISDAQMSIGAPDTYNNDPIGALSSIENEIQRHIDRHMQNGSVRSHEIIDALENYLGNHRDISHQVSQQLERQRQQTDVPNLNEMTPSMIDLYQNGLDSPIQSSNNRRYSRQVTNAYRDILGSIADQGGNPRDANSVSEHLSMYYNMLDNADPEVMAELGIRNTEQANQLSEILDDHLTSIDRLERDRRDRQQVRQQQAQPAGDTTHTNNISQIIDDAINNFSDVNQPNDVASFNSALQRAFQVANPVTNPEDYIAAILEEGRALTGTPARNALQNLAISMNNYHVAHPSARNERSANYDANRILGQQQHQEQEPRTLRPHEISHLASQLINNDRSHTGGLDIPSSDATLWALANGQMDLPEYRHIPVGDERARAMEPLRAAYQTARDSVLRRQIAPTGVDFMTAHGTDQPLPEIMDDNSIDRRVRMTYETILTNLDATLSIPEQMDELLSVDRRITNLDDDDLAFYFPRLRDEDDVNSLLNLLQHHRSILQEYAQRLNRPQGHKDGGHIKFAKTVDQMRFALMKGK